MAIEAEYKWVEENVPKEPCRIFNFGCRVDKTVGIFLEKGYSVVGVDLLTDRILKGFQKKIFKI